MQFRDGTTYMTHCELWRLITEGRKTYHRMEKLRDRYKAGKKYLLIVDVPNTIGIETTHTEARFCTCIGVYSYHALFEYVSPKTGKPIKRDIQYLDIREVKR